MRGQAKKESTSATTEKMLVRCAQVAAVPLLISSWVPTLQELQDQFSVLISDDVLSTWESSNL